MVGRLHLRMVAVLAPLLLVAAPAGASAARSYSMMTIGPIRVHHDYSLVVEGGGCNGQHPSVEVLFIKELRGGFEAHGYAATSKQSCHLAPDASAGSLQLRLAEGTASIDVAFHKQGPAKRRSLPPPCSGAGALIQRGVVTGTFDVAIDGAFFGRIRLHRVSAKITRDTITCNTQRSQHSPLELSASFGGSSSSSSSSSGGGGGGFAGSFFGAPSTATTSASFLNALRFPAGRTELTVGTTVAQPSGVSAFHSIELLGRRAVLAAAGNLDAAHIDSGSGPVQGHLRFQSARGCVGTIRRGTLSGDLKIHFDVIGTQTLMGPSARGAKLIRLAAAATGPGRPCSA